MECVLTRPGFAPDAALETPLPLFVPATACLTGAGDLAATLAVLAKGDSTSGLVEEQATCATLPPRQLKRLARLALALAARAVPEERKTQVTQVFWGTGWGALSETAPFLTTLFQSRQQFPSPTDFVGSVHNAPAGQIALWLGEAGGGKGET